MRSFNSKLVWLAAGSAVCVSALAHAQTPFSPAFTYRADLANGGAPAAGSYDFRFRLFNASGGGTQVGPTLCVDNLVVAGGRVTTLLDFGSVFGIDQQFLEVEVREDTGGDCSSASGYTTLLPRQVISATPQATFAANAASADTALSAASAVSAGNALSVGGQPASNVALLNGNQTFSGVMNLTNAGNSFAGNGSGLTLLNASAISTGTLSAARMPADWPAGGDLTGFFPSPLIAPGSVGVAKLSPDVQSVLSQWTAQGVSLGEAVAWGSNGQGQTNVPALPPGLGYSVVGMGYQHGLAMRSDGVCIGWGLNSSGEITIPSLPPGVTFTSLGGGDGWSCGLRSDGQIVAWGYNGNGQTNVPALPPGVTYTAVSAQVSYAIALRSDGQAVAWGDNGSGQTDVPALPPGLTYTAVGAGENHAIAVLSDGTVVAWGNNSDGQADVPPGLSGVVAVRAGEYSSMALKSDGTIVPWGWNGQGALNVPALPPGLTYTAVAGSHGSWLGLRSNGTVVSWGYNGAGQNDVPPGLVDVVAIATGVQTSLALRMPPAVPSLSTSGGVSVAGAGTFANSVTASSFEGSGAGLTNLSASNLTGTIQDTQLSSNVVRLNAPNAFTSTDSSSFAGNLGIGTSTPTEKLHVSGGDLRVDRGASTSGAVAELTLNGARTGGTNPFASVIFSNYDNDSGQIDYTGATIRSANSGDVDSGDLSFWTKDTAEATPLNRLYIASSGNVGIGTNAPNDKLEVKGNLVLRNGGQYDDAIRLVPGTTVGNTPEFVIQDASVPGQFNNSAFHMSRNAVFTTGDVFNRNNEALPATGINFNNAGDVVFRYAGSGNVDPNIHDPITWTNHLLVDGPTGNVGIGTVNPLVRLDVRTPDATSAQFIAGTSVNGAQNTYIKNNTIGFGYGQDAEMDGWINLSGYQGSNTQFRNLNIGNGRGGLMMSFDAAQGFVGIGTATPTSRLTVAGNALVTNTLTATSFVGFGGGLTGLSASNITTGTVAQSVLPVSAWFNSTLLNNSIASFGVYLTIGGTSQVIAMRQGVAVISWSTSALSTNPNSVFSLRVKAVTGGVTTLGPETMFATSSTSTIGISGNAVVTIPSTASTTFTLEVTRITGSGNYTTDSGDSFTATIINIGQ